MQIEGDPDSPMNRGRLSRKESAVSSSPRRARTNPYVKYRRPFGTEWEQLGLDTAMDMIADRVPGARRHGWQREVDRNRTGRTLGFAGWAARS